MNKAPGLFIVGAPKSGTTALAQYLSEHPEIFISTPKEPHYFAYDLEGYRAVKNEQEYAHLFLAAKEQETVLGEASVFYLSSETAIPAIRKFNPAARILVMLRNPVDMVYSLHSQLVQSGDEDELDFAIAWQKVEARLAGKDIPKLAREIQVLNYRKIANYGFQISRLFNHFPREQIKIILFEDFKNRTAREYEQTLEFLELESDARTEFPVVNQNTQPRLMSLKYKIKDQGPLITRTKNFIKKTLGVKQLGIAGLIDNINTRRVVRPPLPEALKNEILETYREDINNLEEMLNVDLGHWKT